MPQNIIEILSPKTRWREPGSSVKMIALREIHLSLTQIQGTATGTKTLVRVRPRGFCAGVVRAVDIVDLALELYGQPVYVHHEIVHNRYVVDQLRRRGAIFVESMIFRSAGMVDAAVASHEAGTDKSQQAMQVLEEYAIESSISKVYGSETVDYLSLIHI